MARTALPLLHLGFASGQCFLQQGHTRPSSTDAVFFASAFFLSGFFFLSFLSFFELPWIRAHYVRGHSSMCVREELEASADGSARTAPASTGVSRDEARGLNCYGLGDNPCRFCRVLTQVV